MDQVIQVVDHAFADAPRPEHPLDHPDHCEECRAYDTLMRSRDRATLTLDDMRLGWSPLVFLNAEAFRYFFPALVRLCIAEDRIPPDDPGYGFAESFIDLLATPISKRNPPASLKQTRLFDREQIDATLMFLRHLREIRHSDPGVGV